MAVIERSIDTPAGAKPLWTKRQTGGVLGVCDKTLHNLEKRGQLKPIRIGTALRYDPADVAAFIESQKGAANG